MKHMAKGRVEHMAKGRLLMKLVAKGRFTYETCSKGKGYL